MKHLGKIILAVSLLFLVALPILTIGERVTTVQAETEATEGAKKGLIKTGKEAKTELEENVATLAGKLDARKKEIIKNYFGFMIRRLQAAVNRLSKIIVRIESRIGKIEETDKKINLAAAKQELAKAKENLNQNSLEIKEIQTQMETIIEDSTPKEGFAKIKIRINELKKSLLETRKTLTKIIGEIKGLKVGQTTNPSADIKEVE